MSSNNIKRENYRKHHKTQKREQSHGNKRKKIIDKLVERYGLRCWYCGIELKNRTICVDHIVAFSQGGKDDIDNYALSCKFCNSHKLYYPVAAFLRYLAYIRSGNFNCSVLKQYGKELESNEFDRLQKSYY